MQDAPGSGSGAGGAGGPGGSGAGYAGWGSGSKGDAYAAQSDGQFAKLKDDIMSLSVRERKRIKQIAKDQANGGALANGVAPPPTILATRQAMLPKIPLINMPASSSSSITTTGGGTGTGASSSPSSSALVAATNNDGKEGNEESKKDGDKPALANGSSYDGSNPSASGAPGTSDSDIMKSKTTQSYTHDIIQAYEEPLATDSYELPDTESLNVRMLGIALENGLVNGVDGLSADVMLAALEYYLKGLVQTAFDTVKRRKAMAGSSSSSTLTNGTSLNKSKTSTSTGSASTATGAVSGSSAGGGGRVGQPSEMHETEDIITVEDISRIIESAPSYLVEVNGPFFRMNDTMRMDDDEWAKLSGQMFEEGGPSAVVGVGGPSDAVANVDGSGDVVMSDAENNNNNSSHNGIGDSQKKIQIGMGVSNSHARLIAAVASSSGPHGNIDVLLDAIVADGVASG